MKNLIKLSSPMTFLGLFILATILFLGCQNEFDYELPDANSKEDTVFPTANFSYASSIDDFKKIRFSNLSFEAIDFAWDFGSGNTSTDKDPIFTFPDEGTYPVTLVASDGNGVTGEVTIDVLVVEGPFQPVILEASFEDGTLDGAGDGRDSWRNNAIDGVIQITQSPVTFGSQAAKLPADQSRIGYQEITVEPNTNYDLTFWYTMLAFSADPFVTVSILGVTATGTITSREDATAATLASVTVNDDTEPSVYLEQELSFNSGDNNSVAIYFTNGPVEARLDNFSIEVGLPGAVPPSVGFETEQSSTNYLEYTFTNTSTGGATYLWDFGDGNTSIEESPTHVYDTHDIYTVKLTVTNATNLTGSLERTIDIQAPVTADFSFEIDPGNYRTVNFMDASVDAVSLLWDFGDEFQFTGMNPSHTYTEDAIYTVTLTATSITGLQDVSTRNVTIAEGFIPAVKEAGFEDDDPTATCGGMNFDGRDCWRNDGLGGVIQITQSPTNGGVQAAKLPDDGSRVGYQLVDVEANTDYTVSFHYTMKTEPAGSLTVSILDGSNPTDPSQVAGATIAATTVNDQSDASAYILETIAFNSGANTQIAIYFNNEGVECRLDDISID